MQDDATPRAITRRQTSASAYQLNTIGKADLGRLQRYFARLSPLSRQQRFHGPVSEVDVKDIERVMDRAACTIMVENRDQPVGEAVLFVEKESACAEIALSTADDWQGRGIGRALLSYLERKAVAANARKIYGDTLGANRRMLALARRCGYAIVRTPGD